MYKNLSFHRLVLYLTALLVVLSILSLVTYEVMPNSWPFWIKGLLVIGGVALVTYLIVRRVLNLYMYRRIKLIYKMIRSSKVSIDNDKNQDLTNGNMLDKAEIEVSKWMREKQDEIQSLKALEQYRQNFLGNISHELKTPIFAVQGYIHTLLDGGIEDPDVNYKFLHKAASNIDRLETIVGDLDVIAKLEDATLALEKQDFDIRQLALDVIASVEVQARIKGIELSLKSGADKGFLVLADKEYIRTVLVNLIVNSIKYGRDGGKTKIAFYDMDHYVLVEVADNGLGIDQKHIKHIFDRFYRVDKSRSRNQGGSGLGLSIVKHIIEAHQQTINVRSTLNAGTTIGFTLEKYKAV